MLDLHIGVVVSNNDPQKRGRIRVRIPQLHGNGVDGMTVADAALPWAVPGCLTVGYHSGQMIVPVTGATVYILAQSVATGPTMYIYLGGFYSVGHLSDYRSGRLTAPAGEPEVPERANGVHKALVYHSQTGSFLEVDNDNGNVNILTGTSNLSDFDNSNSVNIMSGSALIQADNDHVYVTASNEIKLEVGGSSVTITPDNITLKTGGSIDIQAGGNITLTGSNIYEN